MGKWLILIVFLAYAPLILSIIVGYLVILARDAHHRRRTPLATMSVASPRSPTTAQ